MIIKMNLFLSSLEKYPYVNYEVYETDYIVYISLYGEEEAEKFVIIEPVSATDRARIHAALEQGQKSMDPGCIC
jgi:hypothetical protein